MQQQLLLELMQLDHHDDNKTHDDAIVTANFASSSEAILLLAKINIINSPARLVGPPFNSPI